MIEIRLAKKDDIILQKELWKICFGDDESYIDFYFENKYKDTQAVVLFYGEEMAAMATMIPTKMILSDKKEYDLAMLYAIATHPKYQGKGFSTKIIDFANNYLKDNNKFMSILVPAEESLFGFYRRRGYKDGFYIREMNFTLREIEQIATKITDNCIIKSATSSEYNISRENMLNGTLHIAYSDTDIEYQKSLSRQTGADIYLLDIGGTIGCSIIERINDEKIIIKELLLPDYLIEEGLKEISNLLSAQEYIIRLPAHLGNHLGGEIRHFGMVNISESIGIEISKDQLGYLGIAYD